MRWYRRAHPLAKASRGRSADCRFFPFHHRSADAVRGDGFCLRYRRPVAACSPGCRTATRRRLRSGAPVICSAAAGGGCRWRRLVPSPIPGRSAPPTRFCAAPTDDVGRCQKLRRPARPYRACWRRARRSGSPPFSSRASRNRCKRASAWCRRSRASYALLCRVRALVRPRPRSVLALADIGAGRRACRAFFWRASRSRRRWHSRSPAVRRTARSLP